jgi:hypothetical protein
MINKEKTITKAFKKYKDIYPMKDKKTFEECFFFLHGEILFVFRTKNMKIRTLKAVRTAPIIYTRSSYWQFLTSIRKVLTKPISFSTLVRPSFARISSGGQGRSS